VRIELLRGEDILYARDLEVRSHADLEVGVADTLRHHRLTTFELEPLWESAIKVTRLGLA
jgi:hypothetical protein